MLLFLFICRVIAREGHHVHMSIFRHWRGDLLGGIHASLVALPLAMAFGVESGLGATSGIIGALVVCVVGAWVGGAPWLVSGPTGPLTVYASLIIAQELETSGKPESALSTIFIIFVLAGAFQVLFGWLRLGHYFRYVPYPLISGFLSGIGLMMVIFQLLPLLGHGSSIHIYDILQSFPAKITAINWAALVIGLFTIGVIYLFPRKNRMIFSSLLALVLTSVVAYWWLPHVPVIGDISDQWIDWRWHHLLSFDQTRWDDVFVPALTLALLASIDTLLTVVVAGMMVPQVAINHNKHLVGQGLGNMLAALAGGLPGAGATLRTVLNIRAGARTGLATLVHAIVLVLALVEFDLLNHIPQAALAGVLITVGISIIDYQGLRDIRKIPRSDAIVMLVVMLVAIFFGLLQAFAAGIILASLFFVKAMADQNLNRQEPITLIAEQEDELAGRNPIYLQREVYIQEFSGPLFFGFAAYMKEALMALTHTRAVIFRMDKVTFIDQSGIYALKDIFDRLRQKGIVVVMTGLSASTREQLERMNIIPAVVKGSWIFPTFAQGADWLLKHLIDNPSPTLQRSIRDQLELDKLKKRLN